MPKRLGPKRLGPKRFGAESSTGRNGLVPKRLVTGPLYTPTGFQSIYIKVIITNLDQPRSKPNRIGCWCNRISAELLSHLSGTDFQCIH